MPDFTVHNCGVDSSGRAVLLTGYMRDWFEGVVRELGFRPTIVQGAWMSRVPGGGADASAGYHDGGGCLDLRTWDLTRAQQLAVIRVTRRRGAGSWIRDEKRGGMDPHIHLVLGSDRGLSSGASWQWSEYVAGRDGLSTRGPDYHPRPHPLVIEPPEDDMPYTEKQLRDIVDAAIKDATPAIAAAAAKAVMESDVIAKLDVSVREVLRAEFAAGNKRKG